LKYVAENSKNQSSAGQNIASKHISKTDQEIYIGSVIVTDDAVIFENPSEVHVDPSEREMHPACDQDDLEGTIEFSSSGRKCSESEIKFN
jgi:hypothetical protein